ncbi:MAG: hypothetical protein Q9202_004467 [Teloschistes flavicans]
MTGNGVRLSEAAGKGVPGAFFGLAMAAAFGRIFLRLRSSSRVTLGDALFLFACVCLTTATGIYFTLLPKTYIYEESAFRSSVPLPSPTAEILKETIFAVRLVHAYLFISWLGLFAIKFCFLAFFRALIDRVMPMMIYWRVVVLITIILGGVSVNETFITCPYTDEASVVSIPIALLWNARIRLRQKLGIGALLCLSVVMSIIAIVKASGIRTPSDSFDILWELFWQQIEACVAVLMVSITAFRSLFTSNKPKATNKESPYRNFSKPLQHSPWSSRNKTEGGAHSQLRSPASQEHEMNPPYMTGSGSTHFQSVHSMEPAAERIQHRLHSIDLEDHGCESELHDLPATAPRGDSHDEALILRPAVQR